MFIELTDHLRCPEDHEEQYLVLLPDEVRGRDVVHGSLACPVCGRVFEIADGIARFGIGARGSARPTLSAGAALALLGIQGPGGYVALVGAAGAIAADLEALWPNVHFALIDPPSGVGASSGASILEAESMPLKSRSMRGVVVGADFGGDVRWVASAARSVLPGNRIVVEGEPIAGLEIDLLASAPGAWVGAVRTKG